MNRSPHPTPLPHWGEGARRAGEGDRFMATDNRKPPSQTLETLEAITAKTRQKAHAFPPSSYRRSHDPNLRLECPANLERNRGGHLLVFAGELVPSRRARDE